MVRENYTLFPSNFHCTHKEIDLYYYSLCKEMYCMSLFLAALTSEIRREIFKTRSSRTKNYFGSIIFQNSPVQKLVMFALKIIQSNKEF